VSEDLVLVTAKRETLGIDTLYSGRRPAKFGTVGSRGG